MLLFELKQFINRTDFLNVNHLSNLSLRAIVYFDFEEELVTYLESETFRLE